MPFVKNINTIELLNLPSVRNYFENTNIMNKSTAEEYINRLRTFNAFLIREYDGITIETLLENIKDEAIDTYSILSKYSAYLKNCNVSSITIKQRVVTIKNFFEYHDIEVSPRKFKLKVRLPKIIRKKRINIKRRCWRHSESLFRYQTKNIRNVISSNWHACYRGITYSC